MVVTRRFIATKIKNRQAVSRTIQNSWRFYLRYGGEIYVILRRFFASYAAFKSEPVTSTEGVGPREVWFVDEVHPGSEFGVDVEGRFFEGEGYADRHADSEPVSVFGRGLISVGENSAIVSAAVSVSEFIFGAVGDHITSPAVVAVFDTTTDVQCEGPNVPVTERKFMDILCVEVEVSSTVPATTGDEVDGAVFAESDLEGGSDDGSYGESDTELSVERAFRGAGYCSFGVVGVLCACRLAGGKLCGQTEYKCGEEHRHALQGGSLRKCVRHEGSPNAMEI